MFGRLRHISPRTRILFFAIFFILLPGAILSYFGFRSISEKAENLTTTYRGTVNLVRDRIETEILRLEEPLRSSLTEQQLKSDSFKEIEAWLGELELKHPGLGHFFLVNSQGGVISATVSLGWVKREKEPELGEIAGMTEFRSAEESEFVKKDCAAAVQSYKNVLTKTRTPAGGDFVLSRIGRCYFKMKRYREGIDAYKKIVALPDQGSGSGIVPSSIAALTQIADGYASLGEDKKREATLFVLYERLLYHPWDLEGGEYSYYLNSSIEEVNSIVKNSSNESRTERGFATLKEREKKLFEEFGFIRRIHQNLAPQVLSEISREIISELVLRRIPLILNDTIIEISYFRLPASFQRFNITAIGYAIDEEYLASMLLPGILGAVDLGKDLVVGILGSHGTPRYLQKNVPTSKYLMAENFSKTFSTWKVALFHPDGKTVEELVGREKHLYLALFLGIVAVMVIGIVFVGRAALHEVEASRMKSEFVSSVSHELKTPLALIRMFGETLESGLVSDEAKRQEFYHIITKESERLTHLINNVLNFSKMETGSKQYRFEEDDIVQVIRGTLEAYRFHIRDLGFEMVTQLPDDPIVMMIDKDAISQALLNLLNNAAKYSDEQKFIRVELAKNVDWVLISVEDRGVGIPQDELGKIFEKFYRASTTRTKETTGSGLGLTLVKHIVEAHAGSVDVSSTVGGGSRLVLRLPLQQAVDS
ncbi:MAG: ATP-binding protein [Ignavibacteria bacterium]|nr:ATP-binding protein [Ignavibacteria bacterium]